MKKTIKLAEGESFVVLPIEDWSWIAEVIASVIDRKAWSPEAVQATEDMHQSILVQASDNLNVWMAVDDEG